MNNANEINFRVKNSKAEIDLALAELKSLLEITEFATVKEATVVKLLSQWHRQCKKMHHLKPFREIGKMIHEFRNRHITLNTLRKDLIWVCDRIREAFSKHTATELENVTRLLSSPQLSAGDLALLNSWLCKNHGIIEFYPYNELRDLFMSILWTGNIEAAEKLILASYLKQYSGDAAREITSSLLRFGTIQSLYSDGDSCVIEGKKICLSGIFTTASKPALELSLKRFGARITEDPDHTTDILVVAENNEPLWDLACYGRSVDAVLALRAEGREIKIFNEEVLVNCLSRELEPAI